MSSLLKVLAAALFILALPVVLFFGSLIWIVLDVATYQRLLFEYGAAARTGLNAQQLNAVAVAFANHFRDGTPITLSIVKGGISQPLFTEREIVHLQDVHHLVQFGVRSLAAIGFYILAFAAAGLSWWRGRYWRTLAGHVRLGAVLTLGLLVALAMASLLAFDRLFWLFHQVSFPNDFWLLDPTKHYLINLFSQQFALDTVLLVALAAAVEALLLTVIASLVIRWSAGYGPAGRTN
mgnify:CR=1 FL=1